MQAPHDGARGDARKRHHDPSGAVNAGTPVEPRPAADAAAPGEASPFRTVPNGAPDEAKEPAVGAAAPAAPESDPDDCPRSERAVVDALLACLPMHEDGTGHVADCGYDWEVTAKCGCYTLPARLAAIVREHTERAWDEGFDRGFYDPLAGHGATGHDASESLARNPYAARQEQNRD